MARRAGPPDLKAALATKDKAPSSEEPFTLDYVVYVVWRPWESCKRCWAAMKAERVVLPDEGDYVCPHTMRKEYKQLLDSRSSKKCEFASHESVTLKNGVIQISVGIVWHRAKETADDAPTPRGHRPPVL